MVSNVVKLVILVFLHLGWYPSSRATAMPGQSGSAATLNNVWFSGGFMPLALGFVAQQYGLQSTLCAIRCPCSFADWAV